MTLNHRTIRGYVLLEVVVSVVVFMIGIGAVMRAFSVAMRARGVTQDYSAANFLSHNVISEAQLLEEVPPGTKSGGFGDAYPRFKWTRTVTFVKYVYAEEEKTEEQEEEEKPKGRRRISWGGIVRRRKTTEEKSQSENGSEEREPLYLKEIDVTVSWTRRRAKYSISAETSLPIAAEIVEKLTADEEQEES